MLHIKTNIQKLVEVLYSQFSSVQFSPSVVSDSPWPHGLQPTRLLHPWDFSGESTGVGCHCLLWCSSYSWCQTTALMLIVAQKEIRPSESSPVHLGAAYTLLNRPPQPHLFQLPEQWVAGIAPSPLAAFKGLSISMILNLRDAPQGGSPQAAGKPAGLPLC